MAGWTLLTNDETGDGSAEMVPSIVDRAESCTQTRVGNFVQQSRSSHLRDSSSNTDNDTGTGELSKVLSESIPNTTDYDEGGTDVDGQFTSKSLTEVITDEGENDGGEEKRRCDDTELRACGAAKVAVQSVLLGTKVSGRYSVTRSGGVNWDGVTLLRTGHC